MLVRAVKWSFSFTFIALRPLLRQNDNYTTVRPLKQPRQCNVPNSEREREKNCRKINGKSEDKFCFWLISLEMTTLDGINLNCRQGFLPLKTLTSAFIKFECLGEASPLYGK